MAFETHSIFPCLRTGAWDCSRCGEVFTLSEYHVVVELKSAASCVGNGRNFSTVNQCLPATFVIYVSRNAEDQRGRESAAEWDFLANGLICGIFRYAGPSGPGFTFKPHTPSAKLSQNMVCYQRSFMVLIVVHHVKLEQNSYLFQLAASFWLPFLQNTSDLDLNALLCTRFLPRALEGWESPFLLQKWLSSFQLIETLCNYSFFLPFALLCCVCEHRHVDGHTTKTSNRGE